MTQANIIPLDLQEEHPGGRQLKASDPLKTVWVGASAGTGKTKVLIDRVLRLMLPRPGMKAASATKPGRILCLTFTKTAAAEMSNRVYKSLSAWAVMEEAKLVSELRMLTGEEPARDVIDAARRLFARVLETPGGLKIMTIHSFCQSVLKRFPVEAGLPPHFELMDDQAAVEYLTSCLHDLIAAARRDPEMPLAQAFGKLALHLGQEDMSSLMSNIMSKRRVVQDMLAAKGGIESVIETLHAQLGVDRKLGEEDILQAIGDIAPEHEDKLKLCLRALLQGSKNDKDKAGCMQLWLEQKARRGELYDAYRHAWFTKTDGKIYSTLATKAAVKVYPDIVQVMQEEAERLSVLEENLRAVRLAALNAALLTMSAEMIARYERHKTETDRVDYDDLIIRTRDLLSDSGSINWVMFKLDEQIDHILVDEAQDTSPAQWDIVLALTHEFFEKKGSRENILRTLFVVGDEKQSIFSFQGADPRAFDRVRRELRARVRGMQEGFEIFLEHSFRSTRAVLETVDTVFAGSHARRGVVADVEREVRHLPFRKGQAGLVEIWPVVRASKKEDPHPWETPDAPENRLVSQKQLAVKIAATVRGWLDKGEVLASKGRALRAGDILVLVRTRSGFVDHLLRAFKSAGVPVAGVDRLTLTEEIAVMDLLAVAEFALLPRDDLKLATVLRSPLVNLSEENLFLLCHERKGTLWSALKEQKPDIFACLEKWTGKAARVTPYEFFVDILTGAAPAGGSGRRALYGRLGYDIQDAVDEFLNRALSYEQTHTPSLQKFVGWFLKGEAEIKREQEQGRDNLVRIMTVHAAKGLQAPVVFLPDTVGKPRDRGRTTDRMIWPEDKATLPLWSPRRDFDARAYETLKTLAAERQEEEYRRLLYVALTRAEDRLYIAGWSHNKPPEDCWYSFIANAFAPAAVSEEFLLEGAPAKDKDGTPLFLRRVLHPQEVEPEKEKEHRKESLSARKPLPDWALAAAPSEPSPSIPLTPSRPGEDEPAVRGPLLAEDGWKFRRGLIVHRMLEILPQLPQERWEKAIHAWLARPQLGMEEAEREKFAQEVLAVLRHPEFAPIFGPGSSAEVPVVGLTGGDKKQAQVLSGQMDRVLVTPDAVLIIDYKTNRPPPKDEEGIPVVYLKQMASYISVLRRIYPNRNVKAALLWTDGPLLMPISAKRLDKYT